MVQTIDEGVGTIRGYDLLARAVRVALVVYLSPVILAVLAVVLVAMAVARLGTDDDPTRPTLRRAAPHGPALIGPGANGDRARVADIFVR